jgi:hypothetical protein
MRSIYAGPLLSVVMLVASISICGEDIRPEITFYNNTGTVFCYYEYPPLSSECPEVKPHAKTDFLGECSQDENQPMIVVLTSSDLKRQVYKRTASCKEWKQSGAIIIEERDDGFVITDSLPGEPRDPNLP